MLSFHLGRMLMRVVLLGSAGVALCPAANIYIAQNAAGANTGADCADAHSEAWFNASSNWGSGSAQIGPGTTVHVCGTFTGGAGGSGLTAQGSGTSGNPITILFEQGAKMTAPYWSTAINISNLNYIVIDGGTPCGATQGGALSPNTCNGTIQNTANGTGQTYQNGSNFILAAACNNCEVRNMALINNYVHTQCEASSGCDTGAGTTENGVLNFSGSNWNVHDNLIHDASWAINFQALGGETNLSFYNNNIYNVAHGIAIYGGVTWPGPVKIYSNRIHDYQNWDTGGTDAYHADGIHAFGMNLSSIYIYDNFFTTQNQCCITSHIFLEGGTAWTNIGNGTYYVFNNVLIEPTGTVNGLMQPYHGTNSVIYNNTVLGPDASGTGGDLGIGASSGDLKMNNNAISSFGILFSFGDTTTTTNFVNIATDLDYQAYGNCSGYNCFFTLGVDTGSFTTWKAQCGGCDTHSSYSASLNLNSDGSLTSNSTALIGTGRNLTSLCTGNLAPLCSDINLNPRPSTGNWDIGAYQHTSSTTSTPPSPPTGLTTTVH